MSNRRIYAGGMIGAILYLIAGLLNIGLGLEGPAMILFFIASLATGIICGSVKLGFALAFILSLVFQIVVTSITQPVALSDPNYIAALLLMSAVNSAISGVLGAGGGLVGGHLIKR